MVSEVVLKILIVFNLDLLGPTPAISASKTQISRSSAKICMKRHFSDEIRFLPNHRFYRRGDKMCWSTSVLNSRSRPTYYLQLTTRIPDSRYDDMRFWILWYQAQIRSRTLRSHGWIVKRHHLFHVPEDDLLLKMFSWRSRERYRRLLWKSLFLQNWRTSRRRQAL